jgi:hypothetical protein
MKKKTKKLIGRITYIRRKNNLLWMRLLEIAVERAPNEAKEVLRTINLNDRMISEHLQDIAE